MIIKYNATINKEAITKNIERLTNRIFKLLPNREEGSDWQTPLENIIVEITGMSSLISDQTELFALLCKLEGLRFLDGEDDFFIFRRNIFECLNILSGIKRSL